MADSIIDILVRAKSDVNKAVDSAKKAFDRAKQSAESLNTVNSDRLNRNLDQSSRSAQTLRTRLRAIVAVSLNRLSQGARNFGRNLKRAAQDAEALKGKLDRVAAVGQKLLIAGGVAGFFGAKAAGAAREYGAAIDEVTTLVDTSVISNKELSDSVQNLSNQYGRTGPEVARGLYQAISAGAEAGAEANDLLDVALRTAIGGVTDVGTAVDGLTTIINAFNLDTSQAGDVADALFVAMKGGKTTVEELSSFLFQAADTSATLGVNFDELLAAVTALTKGGTPTAQAFTRIRAALVGLIRDTPELTKIFQEQGDGSAEATIRNRGLAATLELVSQAAGGSQGQLVKLLGSVEGFQAVVGLTGDNLERFNNELENQADRLGAVDEAFGKIGEGLDQRTRVALTRISNAFVTFGNLVLRVVVPVLEIIADIVSAIGKWAEANPRLATTITALIVTVVALSTVTGAFLLIGSKVGKLIITLLGFGRVAAVFRGVAATISALIPIITSLGLTLTRLVPLIAAVVFTGTQISRLIDAWAGWRAAVRQNEQALEDVRRKLAEIKDDPAADVQIKKAEELKSLNEDQLEIYRQQLIQRLKAVGLQQQEEILTENRADVLRELKAEQDRILESTVQVTDRQKEILEAARGTEQAYQAQRVVLQATVQDTEKLAEAQNAVASISYEQQIASLNRVHAATVAALTIDGGLEDIEAQYLAHYFNLEQLARNDARTREDIALDLQQKKIALIPEEARQTEEGARKILDIERDTTRQIIDIKTEEVQRIAQLREESFNRYQALQQRIAQLSQEISDVQLQGQFRVNDLQRQGLSDYAAYKSRQREIASLTSDFERALNSGDLELAEELARRQLSLAGQLTGEVKEGEKVLISREQAVQNAVKETESAQRRLVDALKAQKTEAESAAKTQLATLQSLDETLKNLNSTLENLTQRQLKTELKLEVPSGPEVNEQVDQTLASAQQSANQKPIQASVETKLDEKFLTASVAAARDVIGKNELAAFLRAKSDPVEFLDEVNKLREELKSEGIDVELIPITDLYDEATARILQRELDAGVVFTPDDSRVQEAINKIRLPTDSLHQFRPETGQVDAAINRLQQTTFSTHVINVIENRAVGGLIGNLRGSIPGFAKGSRRPISPRGRVSGPGTGTSDSIFAALSNGEFVMRSAAVKHYGAGLFQRLNSMVLPRFQGGGSVSAAASGGGSSNAAARDSVDLNLSLGGQPISTLTGSRDSVNNLVTALQGLQKSLAGG